MIERKANTYRLYPTPAQAQQMAQTAGACRFVFNLALEQREKWWRPGRQFNYASQCREVTALQAEVDWLKAAPVHTLQQALKDLDRAYQNFFAGRAGYTSQMCAACAVVDARSRLDQARFDCVGCGNEANADTNAAIVILRRADSPVQPVEGSRRAPVEAGTSRRAA